MVSAPSSHDGLSGASLFLQRDPERPRLTIVHPVADELAFVVDDVGVQLGPAGVRGQPGRQMSWAASADNATW